MELLENILESEGKLLKEYKNNLAPVRIDDLAGRSLAKAFGETLTKWRPWDTRAYLQYTPDSPYCALPSDFSILLYRHFAVKWTKGEDSEDGSRIQLALAFNANMDKHERYLRMAKDFNLSSKVVTIDPLTGKFFDNGLPYSKEGGFIKTLKDPSPHAIEVKELISHSDVLDGVDLPTIEWKVVALWEAEIRTIGPLFKVSHKVSNLKGETLYENEEEDEDLALLTSRMMHTVFGNPHVEYKGDFRDGLRQLIAGEKSGRLLSNPMTTPGFWEKSTEFLIKASFLGMLCSGFWTLYVLFKYGWVIWEESHLVTVPFLTTVALTFLTMFLLPYFKVMFIRSRINSVKESI